MMRESFVAVLLGLLFGSICASGPELIPPTSFSEQITEEEENEEIIRAWVTAYTSSADECGNDLGITASGEEARDGVVACNFLPFGTRVKIPALYGEKEFVVKDRMAKRMHGFIDIWVEEKSTAREIGKNFLDVVVVN